MRSNYVLAYYRLAKRVKKTTAISSIGIGGLFFGHSIVCREAP
jgi:hypothetical protein